MPGARARRRSTGRDDSVHEDQPSQRMSCSEEVRLTPSGRAPLVSEGHTFLPSDACELTEGDLECARVELGETPDGRGRCLAELRNKLQSESGVRYRLDDAYLLRFLRVRKFDCGRALETVRELYAVRRRHPDAFALPPNLEALLDLGFYCCLPYADQLGRILYKVDYEKWDPSAVSFGEILSLMIVVSDLSTLNPRTQIRGIVGIWDMKGLSAAHLAQFVFPRRILLFFRILQGCYPWRIKLIIGVNCGSLSRMFYRALKPFVKTKIIERVILLGSDLSELHRHVSPAVLPEQLGGRLRAEECSNTRHVLDNLPYLRYERSFGDQ